MRPAAQPASARASRHRRRQASHPPHSDPHATRDKSPRRPCLRRGRCARSECAAPPRRRGRGRRGSCPTHDAMLMTFAGRCCAARRSISCSACVRKNGAFRFRSTALSQPASGNSSNAAAQAAPALFTRISSWLSRSASAAARHWAPARVGTSAGSAKHEPVAASSSAVCSHLARAENRHRRAGLQVPADRRCRYAFKHPCILNMSCSKCKELTSRHMLRRYCPPTSNSAFVICPSEHTRTASISNSKTLRSSITACFRRCNIAGAAFA